MFYGCRDWIGNWNRKLWGNYIVLQIHSSRRILKRAHKMFSLVEIELALIFVTMNPIIWAKWKIKRIYSKNRNNKMIRQINQMMILIMVYFLMMMEERQRLRGTNKNLRVMMAKSLLLWKIQSLYHQRSKKKFLKKRKKSKRNIYRNQMNRNNN